MGSGKVFFWPSCLFLISLFHFLYVFSKACKAFVSMNNAKRYEWSQRLNGGFPAHLNIAGSQTNYLLNPVRRCCASCVFCFTSHSFGSLQFSYLCDRLWYFWD